MVPAMTCSIQSGFERAPEAGGTGRRFFAKEFEMSALITAVALITVPVHTLVGHWRPDLELLFIFWMVRSFRVVRKAMNVNENWREYYIPAGPLRPRDWGQLRGVIRELNGHAIEEQGHLFIDCGGGGTQFDQHGRENRDDETSIALVCAYLMDVASMDGGPLSDEEKAELLAILDLLQPFIQVVSDNDATGLDTAVKDESAAASATPHTQRTLRNLVVGLNVLFPQEPRKVSEIVYMAFDGINAYLRRNPTDAENDMRHLMLYVNFLRAVEDGFGVASGDAARFRFHADEAYKGLEKEWELGVKDYNDAKRTRHEAIAKPFHYKWMKQLRLCVIESPSSRASQVARFAPGDRPKPDVVIQLMGKKFMMSTRGNIELPQDLVVALRKVDLFKRGWKELLTQEHYDQLAEAGRHTITVKDEEGKDNTIPILYWTDYKKAFGNAFRSNPFAAPTALTYRDIVRITTEVLQGGPRNRRKREVRPDRKGNRSGGGQHRGRGRNGRQQKGRQA